MSTRVVFANLPRTDALERFAQNHVEAIVDKFRRNRVFSSEVHLQMENSPEHPGRDVYVCEVLLRSKLFKNVVLKKAAGNMYQAIAQASDALGNVLSRLHDRRLNRRRMRPRLAYARAGF